MEVPLGCAHNPLLSDNETYGLEVPLGCGRGNDEFPRSTIDELIKDFNLLFDFGFDFFCGISSPCGSCQ